MKQILFLFYIVNPIFIFSQVQLVQNYFPLKEGEIKEYVMLGGSKYFMNIKQTITKIKTEAGCSCRTYHSPTINHSLIL